MFEARQQAGKLLAEKLEKEITSKDKVVILGIPRGGVVVAKEISRVFGCPLDVIAVKKLGAPGQPELAIGAIGRTRGSRYLDKKLVQDLGVDADYLAGEMIEKQREIKRRERLYRQEKKPLALKDKTIIIADDGAATGATMIAACREVWSQEPRKVIIALPVLAKDTLRKLEKEADEVIYLEAPALFYAVGQFYRQFPQNTDEEVIELLKR